MGSNGRSPDNKPASLAGTTGSTPPTKIPRLVLWYPWDGMNGLLIGQDSNGEFWAGHPAPHESLSPHAISNTLPVMSIEWWWLPCVYRVDSSA